jgi:hypothetical protein
MSFVKIRDDFIQEITDKGIDPDYFVNKLLHQHFLPWSHIEYENELIDKAIEELKPSEEDLKIIHKYISYHVMKDFKERMYRRYEHSIPPNSLDYLLKRLSVAVIESGFNEEILRKNYSYLIRDIRSRNPDFNVRTYTDNMIRIKFMPHQQQRVLAKIDKLYKKPPKSHKR